MGLDKMDRWDLDGVLVVGECQGVWTRWEEHWRFNSSGRASLPLSRKSWVQTHRHWIRICKYFPLVYDILRYCRKRTASNGNSRKVENSFWHFQAPYFTRLRMLHFLYYEVGNFESSKARCPARRHQCPASNDSC